MAEDNTHLVERAAKRLLADGDSVLPGATPAILGSAAGPGSMPRATPLAGQAAQSAPLVENVSMRERGETTAGSGPGSEAALAEARDVARLGGIERSAEPLFARAASIDGGAVSTGDLSAPPAGKLLDISVLERGGMVVGRKSRTRISEEFRIAVGHVLRSLQSSYSAGHGSANLIMVSSSRPGEGKSFTAMNLAGCIAQQNQREVLLVDIDAKQRPITFELGLGEAPGLLDLVRDPSLRIEDVIVPTSIASLSFLPIGARLTSNAEMPLSRPISAVVERLGRRFANRVIILDAPPCLSTSDPSALAPIVGQILMVVEAERTQRNELVAALEMVRVCPSITLLLNKIQLTTSYTFGAYHYFGTYS